MIGLRRVSRVCRQEAMFFFTDCQMATALWARLTVLRTGPTAASR